MDQSGEDLTVGDYVQTLNNLNGTIRFIGEIHQRNGIYYGIELDGAYGKSDGTVGPIRYFKCKSNRGIFVRRRNISQLHRRSKLTPQRIGIHATVRITLNHHQQRPLGGGAVGTIRYIGTPNSSSKTVLYGVEFRKPLGDSDGTYKGAPLFKSKPNYAYFIRSTSKRITFPVVTNSPAPHPGRSKSNAFPKHNKSNSPSNHLKNASHGTSNGNTTKLLVTPHRSDHRPVSESDGDEDEEEEEEEEEEEDEKPRRGNTLQVLRQNAKRHSSPSPSHGAHDRDSNTLIWRLPSPDRRESDTDSSDDNNHSNHHHQYHHKERAKKRRSPRSRRGDRNHSPSPEPPDDHELGGNHRHYAHSQSVHVSERTVKSSTSNSSSKRDSKRYRGRHQKMARSADYTHSSRSPVSSREDRDHRKRRRKRGTYDSHNKYQRKYQSSDIEIGDDSEDEESEEEEEERQRSRRPKSARRYEGDRDRDRDRGREYGTRYLKRRRKRSSSKKRYHNNYSSSDQEESAEETEPDHTDREHATSEVTETDDNGEDQGQHRINIDRKLQMNGHQNSKHKQEEEEEEEEEEVLPDEDEKEELIVEYEQHFNDRAKLLFRLETEHQRMLDAPTDFDPLERLGDWIQSARRANTFKKRYECVQSLMRKVCGGKGEELPMKWNATTNPAAILDLMAKWLEIEDTIVVRKHIMQLLVPLGNTGYPVGLWVASSKSIAKSIITKQWLEKKRSYVQLLNPALIAVYLASHSSLQFWKEWMVTAMLSPHTNCQAQCWLFLARILEIAMVRKSLLWVYQDLETFVGLSDGRIMSIAKETILNADDEELKLSCCLFVYGVARCFSTPSVTYIYRELVRTEHDVYFEGISRSKMGKIFKKMAVRKRKKVQSIMQSVSQHVSPRSINSDHPVGSPIDPKVADTSTSAEDDDDEDEEEDDDEHSDSGSGSDDNQNENENGNANDSDIEREIIRSATAHMVNDQFCTRCIRKNDKIKEMASEMDQLRGQRQGLKELIGNLKTQRSALKKDEKEWTMKVDQSKRSYDETKHRMTSMQQQLYALRKRLYDLKKRERLRILGRSSAESSDLPDVQRLNEWTMYHIVDWMVTLDDGKFMKYEDTISRYLHQQNINGNGLRNITESALRSAGVLRFGDRKLMMRRIKGLVTEYDEYQREEEQQKSAINGKMDKMVPRFPLNVLHSNDEEEEENDHDHDDDDDEEDEIKIDVINGNDEIVDIEISQNTELQSVLSEQLEGAIKGIASDHDSEDRLNVNHRVVIDHHHSHNSDSNSSHSDDTESVHSALINEVVIGQKLKVTESDIEDSLDPSDIMKSDNLNPSNSSNASNASNLNQSKVDQEQKEEPVMYPDRGSVLLDVNHPLLQSGINASVEIHDDVEQPDPFDQFRTQHTITVTKVEEEESKQIEQSQSTQSTEEKEKEKEVAKNESKKEKKRKKKKKEKMKECQQCYERKKKSEGYADDDGVWYCNECWDEFNAEQGDVGDDENGDENEEETDIGTTHLKPRQSHVRKSRSLTDDVANLILNGDDLFRLKKELRGDVDQENEEGDGDRKGDGDDDRNDDDDDRKEDDNKSDTNDEKEKKKNVDVEAKSESASTSSTSSASSTSSTSSGSESEEEPDQSAKKRAHHRKRKSILDHYDLTKLKEQSASARTEGSDGSDGSGSSDEEHNDTDSKSEESSDEEDDASDNDTKSYSEDVTSSRRSSNVDDKSLPRIRLQVTTSDELGSSPDTRAKLTPPSKPELEDKESFGEIKL